MDTVQLINDDYQGHVDVLRHACRGIIVRDGKVLLGYEERYDKYIIPGGGMEAGETQEQCCERELLEETGVICRAVKHYLDIEELFDVWRHINHYFICELIEETGVLHLTAGEKKAACTFVWIPLGEALGIFGKYEQYRSGNVADYGLYRREYTALAAYARLMEN